MASTGWLPDIRMSPTGAVVAPSAVDFLRPLYFSACAAISKPRLVTGMVMMRSANSTLSMRTGLAGRAASAARSAMRSPRNANAHDVAWLNALQILVLEGFIADFGIPEGLGSRAGQHVKPSWGDDCSSEGGIAWINEVDAHVSAL